MSQIHGGLAFQIADAHQVGCPDHVAAERQGDAAEQEEDAAEEGVAEQLPEKKRHHHRRLERADATARLVNAHHSGPRLDHHALADGRRSQQVGSPGAQRRVEVRELGNQGRLDARRPRHRNQEEEQREGKMMDPAPAADQVKRAEGDADNGSGKRPSGKTPVRDHLQEQAARQQRQRQHAPHDQRARGSLQRLRRGPVLPALPEQSQAEQGHEPAVSVIRAAVPQACPTGKRRKPRETIKTPAASQPSPRETGAVCAGGLGAGASDGGTVVDSVVIPFGPKSPARLSN